MGDGGHVTRTLLLSQKQNDTLLVSRGSTSNVDRAAEDISSGHCQIKAFNLAENNGGQAQTFDDDGILLGWGLRNSVGIAEHPSTGGIYSVENSVDEIMRNGVDIHENEPGEEMNYHGVLGQEDDPDQGGNYGYPICFAAWGLDEIPEKDNLTVGSQFVMGSPNDTINDDFCARERVPPRLTFVPHMAPLDIKFSADGSEAFVSFHGSWDRTEPAGYKVARIEFEDGSPVVPANSRSAAIDIVSNADTSACPGDCFRPVGLAFDSKGRLFMSSDSTGEIWVIEKDTNSEDATPSSAPSSADRLTQSTMLLPVLGLTVGFWVGLG
ncbi:MAG: hypothetical protein M1825_004151 [Sarcosagium campestre]|nr:MAG: hypothetical protein M1825_004151 [Sarcosagium campestre]